jgi:hypothetical protein
VRFCHPCCPDPSSGSTRKALVGLSSAELVDLVVKLSVQVEAPEAENR